MLNTGFPLQKNMQSQLADAPEIGLRDPARLFNCPDATDDTIGIHEPDAPIKRRLSVGKSELTLARRLLATAKRAQGDKTCPRP